MCSIYPECKQGTDPEIIKVIDEVRKPIEEKIGKFTVVSYRPEMKDAKHYLVKVQTGQGDTDFAHMLIAKPKDGSKAELVNVEREKTALSGKD